LRSGAQQALWEQREEEEWSECEAREEHVWCEEEQEGEARRSKSGVVDGEV